MIPDRSGRFSDWHNNLKKMNKPKISIVVAVSENRVIGNKGKLPWHILEDMKRFKELTTGNIVIMGRKTYESIPEKYRPLPNRINIVITRNKDYSEKKIIICNSIQASINEAKKFNKEIFIIGGAQIFQQGIKYANKLYLTIVKGNFEGDAFFPDYSEFKKVVAKKESRDDNYQYTFLDLGRTVKKVRHKGS